MSISTRNISDIGVKYPVGLDPSEHQFASIHQEEPDDSASDFNYSVDDDRYTSDADTDKYSLNMESEGEPDEDTDEDTEVEEVRTTVITYKRLELRQSITYASILQEEDDFLPE